MTPCRWHIHFMVFVDDLQNYLLLIVSYSNLKACGPYVVTLIKPTVQWGENPTRIKDTLLNTNESSYLELTQERIFWWVNFRLHQYSWNKVHCPWSPPSHFRRRFPPRNNNNTKQRTLVPFSICGVVVEVLCVSCLNAGWMSEWGAHILGSIFVGQWSMLV